MDIKKIIREELDAFDWIRDQTPIQLEDPNSWVGRVFGYGQGIINQMSDGDLEERNDEETFSITGIDKNGNLTLRKNHPLYGESGDIGTKINTVRDYIEKGLWVWTS